MKRICDILMVLLVAVAVTSCGSRADRPGLVAIDSLILHDPDSACEVLAVYPADSLTNDDDRAYHALLTTIAHYKAYRPATTDSIINIAVSHYDRNAANTDHRMRSLLYKGCVMEELGNPKEAMRFYKEAQYACPENDHFHMGYIQYCIAALYRNCAEYHQSINHYTLAKDAFKISNAKVYEKECIKFIGGVYRMIDADSAYHYINLYIQIAKESKDSTCLYNGLSLLAGLAFSKSDYSETLNIANQILNNGRDYISDNTIFYLCCESYIKLNNIDSAKYILENYPAIVTTEDSIGYYQCKSDVSKFLNDPVTAYSSAKTADDITSVIHEESTNNGLLMIETDFDKVMSHQRNKKYFFSALSAILLLIAIVSYFYIRNKRLADKIDALLEKTNILQNEINEYLLKISQLKQEQKELEARRTEEIETEFSSNQEKISSLINKIDLSIECYSSLLEKLLITNKLSSGTKDKKIRALLNDDFFKQLHNYIDLRYDGLIGKLFNYKLSLSEINIICLELCKFPASIIWIYSDCDRIHSIYRKKKQIAAKVNNSASIIDIPNNIK